MNCHKCKGRVFIDNTSSDRMKIELFCILCGKRWFVNLNENRGMRKALGIRERVNKGPEG